MKYVKLAVPDDFDQDKIGDYTCWQPTYKNVLEHGFVGLIDFMGDDSAVVQAARVSYGKGTKAVSKDRHLLRYLMRHQHTTPTEMVEFKFHVKAPLFVFRQWHRHRTASINEASARYSLMEDEFYIPDADHIQPQSKDNKQGRAGSLSENNAHAVRVALDESYEEAYQTYLYLLGQTSTPSKQLNTRKLYVEKAAMAAITKLRDDRVLEEWQTPTDAMIDEKLREYYTANNLALTDSEYPGVARELARICLPMATYSEMYWKANLKNIFHFLNLRTDSHAQYEIRVYANTMLEMLREHVPWSVEAFIDYQRDAATLSRMEISALKEILADVSHETLVETAKRHGLGEREVGEFVSRIKEAA